MTGFANLADGGAQLVAAVSEVASGLRDPLLLAIIPNGVPVAEPLAEALARFDRPATVISESPDEESSQAIRAILLAEPAAR